LIHELKTIVRREPRFIGAQLALVMAVFQHDASRNYVRHGALGNQKGFVRKNKGCKVR
jgi:hypothetical protein